MKKDFGFKGYANSTASSFWLDSDFDVNFREENRVDYTKLAAAQRAIGNFVNIVTGQQIPVVFQSREESYTDGKRVVIGTKLEDKNFDPAVGLALHEGSHIAFTDFSMFEGATRLSNSKFANRVRLNGMDPDMNMTEAEFSNIKSLLNWIEDRRIDYKVYTNAPGYRMYYEAMYNKYFNDKIIDKALQTGEKVAEDMDSYMFHIINFTNPNRQLDALKELRRIWNLVDLKNINRLKSTEDALDLACDVYRVLRDATANAEQETNNVFDDVQKGNDPGGDSMQMEADESDDDQDLTEDNDDSDKGSSLTLKELDKLQKAIQAQQDFLDGDVAKKGRLTKKDAGIVEAIKESGTETRVVYTDAGGTGCPVETIVVKKLTPAIIESLPSLFASYASEYVSGTRVFNESNWGSRTIIQHQQAVDAGIVLGKKLGNKLQLRNSDKSLKSTRLAAGKIDKRLISQLGYNNVNVFHRVVTDRYKNYFIHISIDASGSMNGDKFKQAITSAVAVAQAASMTTGIRVQIAFRGTDTIGGGREKCVTVYAYDSAHDKMNKIRSYFKYLTTFGCTPEGIAFKSIESDLKSDAKGDELIFLNYSDGEPTDISGTDSYYNGVQFTRRVINGFRGLGMNIVSYFIYSGYVYADTRENFQKMYGIDAQFINPEDMRDVAKTLNQKFLEMAV
jgi:hypothetical protein